MNRESFRFLGRVSNYLKLSHSLDKLQTKSDKFWTGVEEF